MKRKQVNVCCIAERIGKCENGCGRNATAMVAYRLPDSPTVRNVSLFCDECCILFSKNKANVNKQGLYHVIEMVIQ